MKIFSFGGAPQGGEDREKEKSIPPLLTSFEDVRRGWRALRTANTRILNSKGRDITDGITDTMIDSSGKEFHTLMQELTGDSSITARLIADAALVERRPNDSTLYLEGLFVYGKSIPLIKKTTYLDMQEKERLRLAEFLYRPAEERPFPIHQKMTMLYPHGSKIPSGDVERDAVNIEDNALRLLAMNLIESESLKRPSDKEVETLWNTEDRKWNDYIIWGDVPIWEAKIAPFNMPDAIEYLIKDVIGFLSIGLPGEAKERDIGKITAAASTVMPHRKRLAELGYFQHRTTETDRHILLQTVLEGRPLL